jgi:uncharacterized protein (TIGR03437 family)
MPATVTFGGLTAPGLFQLNVVIPNLSPGAHAVQVSWNGVAAGAVYRVPVGQRSWRTT